MVHFQWIYNYISNFSVLMSNIVRCNPHEEKHFASSISFGCQEVLDQNIYELLMDVIAGVKVGAGGGPSTSRKVARSGGEDAGLGPRQDDLLPGGEIVS